MIDMKSGNQSPATLLSDVADDAYPEGLRIEIEGDQLRALGFGAGNLPQVGQQFLLKAITEVVEVCKEDGDVEAGYCIELQLQKIELSPPEKLNPQQESMRRVETMYAPV